MSLDTHAPDTRDTGTGDGTGTRAVAQPGTVGAAAVQPARTPRSAPKAYGLAVLMALLLTAAGGVLVRDAAVVADVVGGQPWTTPLLRGIDGLSPQAWMLPAGIAVAVIGAWLVLLAFAPRRRREITLRPAGVAFIRPVDVARIARTAAGDTDGVLQARSSATRKRVTVIVTTTASGDGAQQVRDAVQDRVVAVLETLDPAPRVTVRTRTQEES